MEGIVPEKNMNKTEFLDQLRQSLNGRMEAEQVADNLRYYEDYINGQLQRGRTESEIMTSLGSPRLIARTIADATKAAQRLDEASREEEPAFGGRGGRRQEDAGRQDREDQEWNGQGWNEREWDAQGWNGRRWQSGFSLLGKFLAMPRWLRYVVGFFVLFLILVILFTVLKFLAPVIALFLLSAFLVKLFRDWLN